MKKGYDDYFNNLLAYVEENEDMLKQQEEDINNYHELNEPEYINKNVVTGVIRF